MPMKFWTIWPLIRPDFLSEEEEMTHTKTARKPQIITFRNGSTLQSVASNQGKRMVVVGSSNAMVWDRNWFHALTIAQEKAAAK
jgi:hypothetical protein